MIDKEKILKMLDDELVDVFDSQKSVKKALDIIINCKDNQSIIMEMFNRIAHNSAKTIEELELNNIFVKLQDIIYDKIVESYFTGCIAGIIALHKFEKITDGESPFKGVDFEEIDFGDPFGMLNKKSKPISKEGMDILNDILSNTIKNTVHMDGKKYILKPNYTENELLDLVEEFGKDSKIVKAAAKIYKKNMN